MVKSISVFFKSIMLMITILVCVVYLLSCIIPYIDTGKYWYISIFGLGFPLLCAFLILLLLFWVFVRSRLWILCFVVLLLGFQQIAAAFALRLPAGFSMAKDTTQLRIMQWNVHNWNQVLLDNERDFSPDAQPDMMALIKAYNADVLCIEEFFENTDARKKIPSNIDALKAIGYPYHAFFHGDLSEGYYYEGIAIFSKYPIVDTGTVLLGPRTKVDPLCYADIRVDGRITRFMAIHLQSVKFIGKDYQNLSKLKRVDDPSLRGGKTILGKLRNGFRMRYDQSVIVSSQIEQSPHPVVLCGDFNDVPNSGVYFNISKNLQDAFLKKGSFIGRTFRFISPTLRIDYIMPSKQFRVTQFKRIKVPYSDHYPLVADITAK